MFEAVCRIVKETDNQMQLERELKKLKKLSVLVGIPQEKASRPGEPINNAELAYIHTNGSPIQGIPARPFIEPAIEEYRENIGKQLGRAIVKTLEGKDGKPYLERAGIVGENAARGWFTNPKNNWEPNSPLTIAKKGSDKPLIDTAEMRKSITHIVREK